jgi:formylglycine-generating enzyme
MKFQCLHGFAVMVCFLFAACKTEPQTTNSFALTPTITVIADTTVPILTRSLPKRDSIFNNMVFVKGGYTFIGSDSSGLQLENPRFWVHLQPFWMDKSPVTVAQFRNFVQATHYKTEAEHFGNGGFIHSTTQYKWILKQGCTWETPNGKDFPPAAAELPVTQVSWNDAQAYAKWAGKRLPHELEFEHAARNARNDQTLYSIGNRLQTAEGRWRVNIWQGTFPFEQTLLDGYDFASPVGVFGETPLGLTDMTGNVWQWCDNGKFNYADVVHLLKKATIFVENNLEKAQRGGSFLCEAAWCHGYRVSGRSFTSPETALMHVGFRCVKDF